MPAFSKKPKSSLPSYLPDIEELTEEKSVDTLAFFHYCRKNVDFSLTKAFGTQADKLGKKWSKLSATQKQPFVDLACHSGYDFVAEARNAEDAHQEAPTTMKRTPAASTTKAAVTKSTGKKKPKGPRDAREYYVQEQRPEYKKQHPEMNASEVTKSLHEQYKGLDDEEQTRYKDLHKKDLIRYREEMKVWETEQAIEKEENDDDSDEESVAVAKKSTASTPAKKSKSSKTDDTEEEPAKTDTKKRKKKKKKDPAKPKKAMGAYMFFSNDIRPKILEENPDIKFTDVAKKIGPMWKALSDDEKKPYEEMAAKDKVRAAKAMEEYNRNKPESEDEDSSDEDDEPKKKKAKKVKDPNAPKKPVSTFLQFRMDNFERIKQANPDAEPKEVRELLTKEFNAAKESPKKKAKMDKEYEKRKVKYEKEMEVYKQKLADEKQEKVDDSDTDMSL